MKFFLDFFPILLFFIAYKFYDIYVATAVAIVASIAQVGYLWLSTRRVESMPLITLGIVVFFGGATLLLQDEMFIKWKPTIVNWIFALLFVGSQYVGKRSLVERMMGSAVELPAPMWKRLNFSWAAFFLFLGFANLYVVYNYSTDVWVNFKLFGMMGLTFFFVVVQGFFIMRYIKEPNNTAGH